MSALWALAFLKTDADPDTVHRALIEALQAEVDNHLYTRIYHNHTFFNLKYPKHIASPCGDDFQDQSVYDRQEPTILLYPLKNELYSIQFVYFFSPMNIIQSDHKSRTDIARALADEEAKGELSRSALAADMVLVAFPHLLERLSSLLKAEIAFVLFVRNPAGEVTNIQFYRSGQYIDEYFGSYWDPDGVVIRTPQRAAISTLFDGRFNFICESLSNEEGHRVPFSAEKLGIDSYDPRYSVYNPDVSRLFVPFWDEDMKPFAEIYYDLGGLLEKSYVKGTAARPVIREIHPLLPTCVLRESPNPNERRLTLRGDHFPLIHHGLQFHNVATDQLSIVFDMEVNWEDTTRITLDMADIRDKLWPTPILPMTVRIMDTMDANYQPISDWSTPFILVDDAQTARSVKPGEIETRILERIVQLLTSGKVALNSEQRAILCETLRAISSLHVDPDLLDAALAACTPPDSD